MQCTMKKTPQPIWLMTELGFFSEDMWTQRVTGIGLQKNPMIIQQEAVHDVKFGVWCTVSAAGITRTISRDHNLTLKGSTHVDTSVWTAVWSRKNTFFFKLGQCICSLGEKFSLLSQHILWQNHKQWPHLPDMKVCDFYLWRMLKDKIYCNDPHT